MCSLCSNFGVTLLVILAATFLIVWSAGQAKAQLGKWVGTIILVIGALAFLYQAYSSISLGCKTGTCPMMNMMGYQNMPTMQQRPMMQKKMQMQQPPLPPEQQNSGQ